VLATVLFWLFIITIAIQCGYALYFFTRIFNLPKRPLKVRNATVPVSVIICAKNEARNLEHNLPAVLGQHYQDEDGKVMYEVIVVNDASEDNTEDVLYKLEQHYSHLWHVTISADAPRTFKGKKFALSKGVSYSSHPYFVMTDADCRPLNDDWIHHLVAPFHNDKEIVAGYGAYKIHPGLLNAFIRWETLHTFLQYSTYAMAGKPYMAVGRNLACTKAAFMRAQESRVWNELPSGDDDLLMHCCGNETNTAIAGHRDSFTISEPKTSWREWLSQKRRHVSTGKYYREEIQGLLGVYAASHAIMWLLFFVLMYWTDWTLILVIMAMRCGIYWTIWQSTALRLQERKIFLWIPLCDLGWAIYNLVLSPYIIWKNKQQWK
jgi:glycosyltransferase involved in cell wall biosynthesis